MGKRKKARVSEQKQARQVEEEEEQQQSDEDHNPTSTNEKTLYEVIKNYIQNFAWCDLINLLISFFKLEKLDFFS